ncbi:MAG: hypothetical protein ACXIVQ_02625 [Acidimicrobiales bacterium]
MTATVTARNWIDRTWVADLDRRAVLIASVVVVGGYVPLLVLGPGTDLDVGGVYRAGRSILDGDYQVSRLPGAPAFEAATAVLHAVGGTLLVNLGSLVMTVVSALAVARLIQREGHPHAGWYGLAVLVNPFVWVAGTSMVDFMWALGFVLVGANLQRSGRYAPAAVMYALAAGCRLSSLILVAAAILADLASDSDRVRVAATAVGAGVLTALIYLPPFLTLGSDFVRSEVPSSTFWVQVGRFGVKNAFFFGPVVIVLVGAALARRWRRVVAAWPVSATARFGVLAFVATQLLFLRFPWKLAHLIPALAGLVLVLAASRLLSRRGVAVLIAAQVLLGLVTVNLAQPDQPNQATGGEVRPEIVVGPWLRDLQCRLDGDRDAYRSDDGLDAIDATWACVVPWSE